MSFKVIKPGLAASWQNLGRQGLGHLGVGRGGAMDRLAAMLANGLVGNDPNAMVYEMHFPAPVLEFDEDCLMALSGADFAAQANGMEIAFNRRIFVPKRTRLEFKRKKWGNRAYLAVAPVGKENSEIQFGKILGTNEHAVTISKWFIHPGKFYANNHPVRVLAGPEWDWLSESSKIEIFNQAYSISNHSNRMGYQLHGEPLTKCRHDELMSSGVLPGTIQLLPNGQPLVLMADCQTTGGYPRILQVIEADLPRLAQMGAGEAFRFELINVKEAVRILDAINAYVNTMFLNGRTATKNY